MKKSTKSLIGDLLNMIIDIVVLMTLLILVSNLYFWIFGKKHLLPLYIASLIIGIAYAQLSKSFRKHDIFGKKIKEWIDRN